MGGGECIKHPNSLKNRNVSSSHLVTAIACINRLGKNITGILTEPVVASEPPLCFHKSRNKEKKETKRKK